VVSCEEPGEVVAHLFNKKIRYCEEHKPFMLRRLISLKKRVPMNHIKEKRVLMNHIKDIDMGL
jgi:hypothetical protein